MSDNVVSLTNALIEKAGGDPDVSPMKAIEEAADLLTENPGFYNRAVIILVHENQLEFETFITTTAYKKTDLVGLLEVLKHDVLEDLTPTE